MSFSFLQSVRPNSRVALALPSHPRGIPVSRKGHGVASQAALLSLTQIGHLEFDQRQTQASAHQP
ncbi:hypothetical protein, partial [Rhizobium sp. Pop5]|uniref:hypothetical protein n=1 Tax=Rhizobium sp. Pop5 TaxID=1223565 RepID=UPI001969B13C